MPRKRAKRRAIAMRSLRRGPDGGAVGAHVGHGAGRPHRPVALHRPVIAGGELLGVVRQRRRRGSLVDQQLVGHPRALRRLSARVFLLGQARTFAPLCAQRAGGSHRCPFILGDDRQEILDPHHLGAGKILDRILVDRREVGADRRRPDHAGMQHVRHAEIVDIGGCAGAFGRHVGPRQRLADDGVGCRILQWRFGIELEIEFFRRRPDWRN